MISQVFLCQAHVKTSIRRTLGLTGILLGLFAACFCVTRDPQKDEGIHLLQKLTPH